MSRIKSFYEHLPKRQRIFQPAYHRLSHYIYPKDAGLEIKAEHYEPENFRDKAAYGLLRGCIGTYNFFSRYDPNNMTEKKWLRRALVLETVGMVPGIVGATVRHFKSLRLLERDKGWIKYLFEKADNERFHMFFIMDLKKPGFF